MTRRFRAALLGCGAIGSDYSFDPQRKGVNTHAAAYTHCSSTELIAVCDVSIEKAQKCRDAWKAGHAYSDPALLLKEQAPEIISICTPNHTHSDLALMAIAEPNTKAIFLEKPIALNVEAAKEISARARQKGIAVAINYTRRFSPGFWKLKQLIDSNELGEIQTLSGYYTKGLLHNGTHWIDLARMLIGDVVETHGFNCRNEQVHGNQRDAQVDAMFRFAKGTTGYLCGLDADAFSLFEMDIVGTKGRAQILDSGNKIIVSKVGDSPYYTGYKALLPSATFDGDMENALLIALENLVDSLDRNAELICTADDGVKALEIAVKLLDGEISGDLHGLR